MSNTRKRRKSENQSAQESPQSLDFQAAPRAAQALRLRRLGYTYDQIAHQCGYRDESGARKAIRNANAKIVRDEAQALTGYQLDMIDQALQVVMQRIAANTSESLWAVDRLTPLLKRQSELMGLDATKESAALAGQILIRRYDADTDAV